MKRVFLVLLLLAASAGGLLAHEVRPAYLEIKQTGLETYDVFWKVPGRGEDLRLGLYVKLPAGTTNLTEPRASFVNSAFAERSSIKRAGGLTGGTIHIAGLSATMTDVLVRVERRDGTTQVIRLTPSAPSFVVEAVPRALEITRTYLVLGVEHILLGIDHLLFVLALLILVKGSWRLVGTITAFTVAHSLTLAGATLGFVTVPGPPVEAFIALSIVFVACEIVHRRPGPVGIDRALAVDCGVHVRIAAWLWFRRGAPRSRPPAECHSSRAALLQRRRRARTTPLRRIRHGRADRCGVYRQETPPARHRSEARVRRLGIGGRLRNR